MISRNIKFVSFSIVQIISNIISKAGDLIKRTKDTSTDWLNLAKHTPFLGEALPTESATLAIIPTYVHVGARLILLGLSDAPKDIAKSRELADLAEKQKLPLLHQQPQQGPTMDLILDEKKNHPSHSSSTFTVLKAITGIAISFDAVNTGFYTLQFIRAMTLETSDPDSAFIYLFAIANAMFSFYMNYYKVQEASDELFSWNKILDPRAPCKNNFRIIVDVLATASIAYGSSSVVTGRVLSTIERTPVTVPEFIQILFGVVGALSKGLYRLPDAGKYFKKNMEGKLEPSKSKWGQRHYYASSGLAMIDCCFSGLNGVRGMIVFANDVVAIFFANNIGMTCSLTDLASIGDPKKIFQQSYILFAMMINMIGGVPSTYAKHKNNINTAYQTIKRKEWATPTLFAPTRKTETIQYHTFPSDSNVSVFSVR